jgi:hypothetical protein
MRIILHWEMGAFAFKNRYTHRAGDYSIRQPEENDFPFGGITDQGIAFALLILADSLSKVELTQGYCTLTCLWIVQVPLPLR